MAPQLSSPLSFTHSLSLSEFAIPLKEYLDQHPEYDGIAGGALVFDSQKRLLIIQRAAHDSLPNLWEIPGGAIDFTDDTILHGMGREVFEESGLRVSALNRLIGPGDGRVVFTNSTKKLKICKFTFEVEVESTDVVTLDPNEHQDYLWVTAEDCLNHGLERDGTVVEFKFTRPAQEATILEGFRLRMEAKPGVDRRRGAINGRGRGDIIYDFLQ
jgi:8-oxo-dGTP pyrophosphatase MutT (NUDIX family)